MVSCLVSFHAIPLAYSGQKLPADINYPDPLILLGQLQLAFIILLHLSSYAALGVYKRIFSLLARSTSIHSIPVKTQLQGLQQLYIDLIRSLEVQLDSLPDGVFDTELPELDMWYMEELALLRVNLMRASSGAGAGHGGLWADDVVQRRLKAAWDGMEDVARRKFGWDIGGLERAQAWYRDTFKERFPRNRKIVIPGLI